jgi:hypothetical protein
MDLIELSCMPDVGYASDGSEMEIAAEERACELIRKIKLALEKLQCTIAQANR